MASKRVAAPARHLFNGFRQAQRPAQRRCMATETALPNASLSQSYIEANLESTPTEPILKDEITVPPPTHSSGRFSQAHGYTAPQNPFLTTITCTTHTFPSFEPTTFVQYPSTHLFLPLRKDILHKAVVYEGDMTRQGTASTKWRSEVHGSNRKIRPQKGTGSARLGNKKSPVLKGGGVAFGPKPRDFSTKLPQKIYDLAWRTALSYRYRKGELILLEEEAELQNIHHDSSERYVRDLLRHNHFGRPDGRTLFVTRERRDQFFTVLEGENMDRQARALEVSDVDVKDLLELGRVVIERPALEWLLAQHQSDLRPVEKLDNWGRRMVRQYMEAAAEEEDSTAAA
ncbi:Ribosomal protein L4/L1 family [Teratosphaeria destructans]|uniref:Large ribosomal subunit protein uL4m n=1 Tax=Teratosphaeria destructans TaxID=418781 RepID=A0A9W7W3B0_9PEZI|nr:Ribosomal protein L4/L1 family [Teratosphaeria destructans]